MRQQRLNELLTLISERGHVTIADVESELSVSAATARRDISQLADQRLVTRIHGGATVLGSAYELPLQYKIARQADAKRAIAAAAAELVATGETVAINGGTTTTEVARVLGRHDGIRPDVTVVTNALNIAYELSIRPSITIVVTGGTARSQSYELVGPLADEVLARIHVDTAVIGVDGVSVEAGLSTLHPAEAKVSADFIRAARRTVVVADHTKLEHPTFARISDLSAMTVLVTDKAVPEALARELARASVEVIVAEPV